MKTLASVTDAIRILANGGVGVMPTDTVYGLLARASDKAAVRRLYALKQREQKPGTVVAANVDQLTKLGVSEQYLRRVEHLWPNPVSVIVPAGEDLEYLHQGLDSLAVRIPGDEALRNALEQTGPLATTSANQPGEPNAVNLGQAQDYFADEVDFYLDGGDLSGRAPSTIVRLAGKKIEVLRQGAMEIELDGMHLIKASRPDCPFCRTNGMLKGEVLAASEGAYLIRPVPRQGNEYLIIPETHVESLAELADTWWSDVKELLALIPELRGNFNMSVNIGRNAGQTVGHVHFWIIPRLAGVPSSGKGLARLIGEADAA